MTDIYIDCEWNGYGGELISMALVCENGKEWYEELDCIEPIPWVTKNVMPHLHKSPITKEEMQTALSTFLWHFNDVTIIADWPEDIERFCNLLITGPGTRISTPKLTMKIVRIDTVSKTPHYALEDARGLAKALMPKEAL